MYYLLHLTRTRMIAATQPIAFNEEDASDKVTFLMMEPGGELHHIRPALAKALFFNAVQLEREGARERLPMESDCFARISELENEVKECWLRFQPLNPIPMASLPPQYGHRAGTA